MYEINSTNPRRRKGLRATVAILAGLALAAGPAAAEVANASTPYWSPVNSTCGTKIVQLTFVATGTVNVGHSQNELDVSNGYPWILHKGTNVINTGVTSIWWMKWGSTYTITKWSLACVNFS